MTGYFDDMDTKLRALMERFKVGEYVADAFDAWEEKLVHDVTCAAAFPPTSSSLAMPTELAKQIHAAILKYAVRCQPVNAPPADFEYVEEHYRRLAYMSSDLHTVFHDVARWADGVLAAREHRGSKPFVPFSDSPTAPLRYLYSMGEEVREGMVPMVEFLVHYVRPGREEVSGLTDKIDKPQLVRGFTVFDVATKVGALWAPKQKHRLRIFERDQAQTWDLKQWRDFDVTTNEYRDVGVIPLC